MTAIQLNLKATRLWKADPSIRPLEVFQSALEHEPGQRVAFLDVACAGNETLRREVESLLVSHNQAGSFLEAPPSCLVEATSELVAVQRADSLIGQRIGPFQIVSLAGKGGMGEVYRATDTRLGRMVAIKMLPVAIRRILSGFAASTWKPAPRDS